MRAVEALSKFMEPDHLWDVVFHLCFFCDVAHLFEYVGLALEV